jgi:hypothetical protein
MSGRGGARGRWDPLLTGPDDAGWRPKCGAGNDPALIGPMIATAATVVPTIALHADMTHAGPHGQME